jgi:UDP-N-acetylmuramoyl-tripeptide--D-alanyl-D-alanine ligase
VVAITGSVGKTSTKEAIALVLSKSGRSVTKTYGNMNTETGVPLSLLGYTEAPQGMKGWMGVIAKSWLTSPFKYSKSPFYVLEYSADKPGDIALLAGHIPFEIGVLTSIVPAHMQAYPKFEDLVKEKLSIMTGLKKGGQMILNADDPVQVKAGKGMDSVLWYGIASGGAKKTGVWAQDIELTAKGLKCRIDWIVAKSMDGIGRHQLQSISVQTALLGKHQLHSLLAAAAVGFQAKIPAAEIAKALEEYRLPAGRGVIIEGIKDMTIIDDTYNASPESVKSGLDMLREFAGKRRTVAILGNMNELGDFAPQAHKDVATYAAGKVDFFVGIGPLGESMAAAIQEAGQASHTVISFVKPETAIIKLDQLVKRGDVVYVKGSQNGVRLERLVKRLMAHPEQAEQLLVRQSGKWKEQS